MKYKLNQGAFENIRTSPQVWDMLEEKAEDAISVLSDGGRVEGYSYSLQLTREKRAAVTIVGKGHARNSNRKHHSLMRVLDAVANDVKKGRGSK